MGQSYGFRVLRALDRAGNALCLGDDEETISHRIARAQARGVWWGRVACRALDLIVPGHCADVLAAPNPSDALMPLDAPLRGDADQESPPR